MLRVFRRPRNLSVEKIEIACGNEINMYRINQDTHFVRIKLHKIPTQTHVHKQAVQCCNFFGIKSSSVSKISFALYVDILHRAKHQIRSVCNYVGSDQSTCSVTGAPPAE